MTLELHSPWPGLAVDRLWQVVRFNAPARLLFGHLGGRRRSQPARVPRLVPGHHRKLGAGRPPGGAAAPNGEQRAGRHRRAPPCPTAAHRRGAPPDALADGPVITTCFRLGDARVNLFATVGQFGSPEDLTLDDLKLELFSPADETSAQVLRALGRRLADRGGDALSRLGSRFHPAVHPSVMRRRSSLAAPSVSSPAPPLTQPSLALARCPPPWTRLFPFSSSTISGSAAASA